MRSVDTIVVQVALLVCFVTISQLAQAQNLWLDTIPQQQVGCVMGRSTIESGDFAKLLRDGAESAGATELGDPFLTRAKPIGDANGAMDWEACAVYKGQVQAAAGFQAQIVPPSSGAFNLCEGTDVRACSDALVMWIKAKSPDFNALTRMIPLFGYSNDKLERTKQSATTLVSQTFLISGDSTPSSVPEPETELDKQLYGRAVQPRQLRRLLDPSQVAPLPNITKRGGEKHYNAIIVFVAISEAQKAALMTP
jgi:hypothetical protein